MRKLIIAILAGLAASCTWVEPDVRGSRVEVAYADRNLGSCRKLGEVTVSVKHEIIGVDRSEMKVRDELESLARNEAATLGASHVQAAGEPSGGEQRFNAYACR